MDFFAKNDNGKYWFEESQSVIEECDLRTSIMKYFNCMVNTGHVSSEMSSEYTEYIRVLNVFLEKRN